MGALLCGWRRDFVNWLLGGGYVALLLAGFELKSTTGWLFALGLIVPASLWAWHGNLKRYRMIVDTPTARVASAPQGYIEIVGRGKQPPGASPLHPFSHLPCLWYRYRIEKRRNDRWETVETGESDDTFGVDDGSGLILIDPEGAEILCNRKQVSVRDGHRYTDWSFIEGDTLYALGEHRTLGSHERLPGRRERLGDLLTEWKQDRSTLLRRFDANRDGQIDLAEWESACREAEREIDSSVPALTHAVHLLSRPADGRPYLVANRNVTELARHYRRWSGVHLVALALAAAGLLALT